MANGKWQMAKVFSLCWSVRFYLYSLATECAGLIFAICLLPFAIFLAFKIGTSSTPA